MTRPRTVKVFSKPYKIQWDAPELDDGGTMGDHCQPALTIRVRKGLAADEERETLMHELLHALERQLDLPLSEKTVRQLSVGFYALLRDNVRLRNYLFKGAK